MCYWRKLYVFLTSFILISTGATASGPQNQTLEFIENRGQWDARARYVAEMSAGRLFVEAGGLTYAWLDATALNHHQKSVRASSSSESVRAHALRVRFVGCADQVSLTPSEPTAEVRNYFYGSDSHAWARGVRGFRQLRYAELWPGIAARLYENQQQKLEYDFELAPAADPTRIRLRYEGGDAIALLPDGSLQVRTSLGTLTELAPKAWQTDAAGQRKSVTCQYRLVDNEVSFELGSYDHQRPLTIDPTVMFSTYTGATADNWGFTATYDAQGNLYSGGICFGIGYPVSTGAYQTTFAGLTDIALIKYNTATTGSASRVWATYLGGISGDFPHSLVVNNQNELVVLGSTSSADYPTTNTAYDRSFGGGPLITPFGARSSYLPNGSDLVVTRLSADGRQLLGSTFLGGSDNDGLLNPFATDRLTRNYGDSFRGDVLADATGNIYIASCTASTNFPSVGGFSGAYKGGATDAVVCKLSAGLDRLLWTNFLGGSNSDGAYSLQLDPTGNLYVAGGTTSANFPASTTALRPSYQGNQDGFLAKISNDGAVLQAATYLGTSAYDQAYFIQIDTEGNVYTLGQTTGSYPVTPGHYANTNGRVFIHKLTPDLGTSLFSTVIGSGGATPNISPTAFLVDQCNRLYLSGWGGGPNTDYGNGTTLGLAVTANALRPTTNGHDFYLMQLSANATALDYATFFGEINGEDHVDGGTSRFDPRGTVYQSVCACRDGQTFPIPPGAGTFNTRSGYSNCNNVAFKFNFETYTVTAGPSQQVCAAVVSHPLYGSPAGGTWSGPGVSGSVAAGYVFTPTAVGPGQYQLTYTLTGVGNCGGTSTTQLTVTPPPTATFKPLPQTSFCFGQSTVPPTITLEGSPAGGQFSGPGVTGNVFSPGWLRPGTYTLSYTFSQNGCQSTASQQVTITRADAGSDFAICSDRAPILLRGAPEGGTWSGPGVSGSVTAGFFFTPTAALAGAQQLTYTVANTTGACAATSTIRVTVNLTPSVTLPTFPEYCVSNTLGIPLPENLTWYGPGVSYDYSYPQGYRYTFYPYSAGAGTHTLTYTASTYYCGQTGNIKLTVRPVPTTVAQPDTLLCPGSTQTIRLKASPAGGTWSGPNVSADGRFTPPAGFTGPVTAVYTYPSGPCTGIITRKISTALPPVFAPVWRPFVCPEDKEAPLRVHFSGVATGAVWDFGDGSQAVGSEVFHTYSAAGRYQPRVVLGFNSDKCARQADLAPVEVKPFRQPPNIITPNGDGLNDVFKASEACPRRLQVFSRWGNQVYESSAYQNDWDGGKQPAGVYYYLLYLADGTKYKGWLEVQR